ncbi:MAG: hypothetical protein HON53_12910 [Planctomycetaceae bacterium]|jgi:hypothetical protein|nr:hypothetical protein [Planctomycetaceae bacterium]MBT6157929.1 hypothetical protein [Planctomycetaceae bacterium]MBT6487455.1 hypothetical protein [Planctomycetaceae bacterium]MBT6495570.1 hypothetical protein [Planctomycetaceae bacterium]
MSAVTFRTRFVQPLLVSSLALFAVVCLTGAKKGPIKKLTFDPDAPVVELFDGIDNGTFEVRVAPKNEFSAKVFITNTTDKPQTVQLPKAAVGVHVLKQFLPQQIGGSGFGDTSGSQGGGGQQTGGNLQSTGSQGSQGQFPFSGNNGNGFFSIPAESIVQLQFNTVCLNHGDPTPRLKMTYELRRVEDRVKSEALRVLLAGYNPRRIDRKTMQAAAWHLANDMSWKQLAAKKVTAIGLIATPYLSRKQLSEAKKLVASAKEIVKNGPKKRRVAQIQR